MKKILSLLCFTVTAALIFSGCQNAANIEDEKMPGTWSTTTEFIDQDYHPFGSISSVTNAGTGKYVYALTNAGAYANNENIKEDSFWVKAFRASKDDDFTGFKATAKSTESEYYGFAFNINIVDDNWNYYSLILTDSSYVIVSNINGKAATIQKWKKSDAIKASTKENEITIYTDKKSNIHILINGSEVYKIKDPELKQGMFGGLCCLRSKDVTDNVSLLTTYNFTEFQK